MTSISGWFSYRSPRRMHLTGSGAPLPRVWGMKIADRFNDGAPLSAASALLEPYGMLVESWRTYNRSFFDALFVEKLVMMLLVGLIFIVVGFNIYHSLRRSVFERMEEIAVLKAMGVPPRRIQSVFVLQGLMIGVVGGAGGCPPVLSSRPMSTPFSPGSRIASTPFCISCGKHSSLCFRTSPRPDSQYSPQPHST